MTREEAISIFVESTVDSIRSTLLDYLQSQDPTTYNLDKDLEAVNEYQQRGIAKALAAGFNDEPKWSLDDPRWNQTTEAFDLLSNPDGSVEN